MFFAISKLKAHCSDYIIKDMATRQIYQDSSDEEVQLRFANLVDFHSPDITFDPNLKWIFKYFFKRFFKRFFSQLNWHTEHWKIKFFLILIKDLDQFW